MIGTNLATRPFYNERAVGAVLAVVGGRRLGEQVGDRAADVREVRDAVKFEDQLAA